MLTCFLYWGLFSHPFPDIIWHWIAHHRNDIRIVPSPLYKVSDVQPVTWCGWQCSGSGRTAKDFPTTSCCIYLNPEETTSWCQWRSRIFSSFISQLFSEGNETSTQIKENREKQRTKSIQGRKESPFVLYYS